MHRHFMELCNYIQYKIIAGLITVIFSDDFFKLLMIFVCLEFIDIFTRWLAQSYLLFKAMYPQTRCGLWRAFKFIGQAKHWRWINSNGMRDGFCDKMLLYLLLLLTSSIVDAGMEIGNTPRVLTSIVVVVLSSTEALSIFENLSDCGVGQISEIKNRFKDKMKK